MENTLGFNKKEYIAGNMHNTKSGYYDNILFNQIRSQIPVIDNHALVDWEIINSGTIHPQGGCKSLIHRATTFGISTNMQTMQHIDNHGENMFSKTRSYYMLHDKFVIVSDKK